MINILLDTPSLNFFRNLEKEKRVFIFLRPVQVIRKITTLLRRQNKEKAFALFEEDYDELNLADKWENILLENFMPRTTKEKLKP